MARMIRKHVYITPAQAELLKRRASELHVTESEIVRRGIDLLERASQTPIRDEQAWQEELAFIRERGRLPASGHGRAWTRDELYRERIHCTPR
jgi:hypothetical protein